MGGETGQALGRVCVGGAAGSTVWRLPLAAARCSGVALCMSHALASWPACNKICAPHEKGGGEGAAVHNLNNVVATTMGGCMQGSPLLSFANCNLRIKLLAHF